MMSNPDVTIVLDDEEEDDEPLYDIKKISILKEARPGGRIEKLDTPNRKRIRLTTYKKNCFVTLCPNTSVLTPNKMFITIPINPARRKLWMDAVGKPATKNPKSPLFCCQDHFELKNDMINYQDHFNRGRVQMILHKDAVPHIFICNDYGHLPKDERIELLQQLHKFNERNLQADGKQQDLIDKVIHEKPQIPKNLCRPKTPQKMMPPVQAKAICIAMPSFEEEDKPEYVTISQHGIDTIIIDDD